MTDATDDTLASGAPREDDVDFGARLIACGLNPIDAARAAALFTQTVRTLTAARGNTTSAHGDGPRHWFVPGRIEVLGKHTDYAGGRSLLCAVERGFCVSAAPRDDAIVRVFDVVNGTEATFRLAADQPSETHWRNYPATVVRRIARNFAAARHAASDPAHGSPESPHGSSESHAHTSPGSRHTASEPFRGADIALGSTLPRAAGLSSSTALLIAIFTAIADINELHTHDTYLRELPTIDALAAYLGCIENGRTFGTLIGDSGVGTLGGSQDHAAILCSRAGHLIRYAYSPPGLEQVVALPPSLTFIVATSGVTAAKTGAARDRYNRASQAAATILDLWNADTGRTDRTLFDALTSAPPPDAVSTATIAHDRSGAPESDVDAAVPVAPALPAMRELLRRSTHDRFPADLLLARLTQFAHEALVWVPVAADALAVGDLQMFGHLVDASQRAAEAGLENQIPETIALARLAREHGAIAASAFGAGFGGGVWALVPTTDAARFTAAWSRAYLTRFPAHADRAAFFATRPGPGLTRL